MTGTKLRVGIIGSGFFAAVAHIPQLRATGRAEVVAIARRNPERLALVQSELGISEAYTDWREMLDKSRLDAVVVCTPHNQHLAPTLAALDRGLHVLLEKPMTDTIEAAQTLVQAAENSRCVVTIGENVRGMRSWRAVKRALDANAIGRLRQISVTACYDGLNGRETYNLSERWRQVLNSSPAIGTLLRDIFFAPSWRSDQAQMGGDFFFEVGVHIADLMLWLGGAPADWVCAMQTQGYAPRSALYTAQARLANGVLLAITFNDSVSGTEFTGAGQGRLTAYGDSGWLLADWSGIMATEAARAHVARDGLTGAIDFEAEGESISPAAAFVASVLDGAPNLCSVQAGAQAVVFIQSAYRSVAEARIITLI